MVYKHHKIDNSLIGSLSINGYKDLGINKTYLGFSLKKNTRAGRLAW